MPELKYLHNKLHCSHRFIDAMWDYGSCGIEGHMYYNLCFAFAGSIKEFNGIDIEKVKQEADEWLKSLDEHKIERGETQTLKLIIK